MSSVSQDQWTPSRLLPSVIFVLTPCIAVGLLVCWSIRLQLVRRRWRAEMARVNPARSDSVIGLKDRPPLYEVWLESTQGSPKPDGIGKYTMPGDTRTDSLLPSQTGSMEHYSWQTILPTALGKPVKGDGWCEVGVLVRMPSRIPYQGVTPITRAELDIATVMVKSTS